MKKKLLTLVACAGIGFSAYAQPAVGTVAPDFTLTDINGVSHHLYNYLDSGYAVIIDVSAAWCGPCWSAHQSHVFENLTDHYGPNGSISAKKVKVIFVEGEVGNATAQLYGPAGSGSGATYSQGDWVAGTNYPIIDNATLNANYLYGGFPSFTVICRDRLIAAAPVGYGSAMGTESYWMNIINGGCPTTAPSATVDAKAVPYGGVDFFLCSANPTVKFQNYSQTQTITSASIKIMSGATVLATVPYTGSPLPPYGVGSVTVPAFTPTASQTGPFNFDVTVTGDSYPANNAQSDIFDVLTAASSSVVPYSENFEASTTMPAKFKVDANAGFFWYDGVGGTTHIVGANGANTKAVIVDFYGASDGTVSEMILSNYNNMAAANSAFEFDVAHAQFAATGSGSNDKLEVFVSTNCGTNWTSVWSKAGTALKTHVPVTTGQFIPTAASDWRHEGFSLNAYKSDNLFIKFKMTSNYGNLGFIDNIKVSNTTGINEVVADNSIQIYPNPATDNATISFTMNQASNVQIQIIDATGRVVNTISKDMTAGAQKVNVSTANLSSGLYNVRIVTEAGSQTQRLSVVK